MEIAAQVQQQQPSGSVGPEDLLPNPALPDQVDQGWGIEWENWKQQVDHGLGQPFPQVGYLTEEIEKLQQQSFPGVFREKVGQIVRESGEINHLVKTQIDGQILALSDVMRIRVKDSVEPLKPQIEASFLEKFQILERSIETQSGQLFRLLNEQNRVTQEFALKIRSETASRTTPAASRPGLDESFVKRLEDIELKMAAAKELSAQTKALFTMNDLLP